MAGIAPACFVLMPFGKKPDPRRNGKMIDFDRLYRAAIRPGIKDAGLAPIRADEERTLGIIQKPMFERLLLSDYAVAELTVPNANVFYELGIRHASRQNTTLPIFADHTAPVFDVAMLRALPYTLGPNSELTGALAAKLRHALAKRLRMAREVARTAAASDSPIFQLVTSSQQGNLSRDARLRRMRDTDGALFELLDRYGRHDKTDIFRAVVAYNETRKRQLERARATKPSKRAIARVKAIQKDLGPLEQTEAGLIIDLYLSYRAIGAWPEMRALSDAMPLVLQRSVLVREQRAFALNRLAGKNRRQRHLRDEAIRLLEEVLAEIGPNPETYGLLGRIHKDRWQEATSARRSVDAEGHLAKSITAYVRGFEADWRDAYPGVNAVTLLDVEGSDANLQRKRELLPVVQFAVERRIAGGKPDYWDHATLLELAVLENLPAEAARQTKAARAAVREGWEPDTTTKNLGFIRRARKARGTPVGWIDGIVRDLRGRRPAKA